MDVAKLPQQQRILVARLGGTAERHAAGRGEGGDPVAELQTISQDPTLLGIAAAGFLVATERSATNQHAPVALRYLRAAGASDESMAVQAVHIRRRLGQPPPSY